jgi:hypothetical protein
MLISLPSSKPDPEQGMAGRRRDVRVRLGGNLARYLIFPGAANALLQTDYRFFCDSSFLLYVPHVPISHLCHFLCVDVPDREAIFALKISMSHPTKRVPTPEFGAKVRVMQRA